MSFRPFNWHIFQQNRPKADVRTVSGDVCFQGDYVAKLAREQWIKRNRARIKSERAVS